MDMDLSVAKAAAERWQSRGAIREPNCEKLKAGRVVEVETPERVQMRLERLTLAATAEKAAYSTRSIATSVGMPPGMSLVETIGLERVMGRPDFLGINFLELALAVSRFVGRIHIRTNPGRTAGFGTGFMVSPRLLLTNNHVLGRPQDAIHSEVEFDYQFDRSGRPLPVVIFGLDPQQFFLTSKELDYTLVAVREASRNGVEVRRYGWNRLIKEQGKALLGDALNIIQHPKGEAKQIVLRSNQLVDLFDHFAHYITDTEPGSSGSPVYNDQWEIVALHHSGVPKVEHGNYIAKDGSIWRPGMDPDDLDWVANEGIRVSSLVEHIVSQPLSMQQQRLRDEMLKLEPPDPIEAAQMAADVHSTNGKISSTSIPAPATPAAPVAASTDAEAYTWTIPLQISIRLGTPTATSGQAPPPQQPPSVAVAVADGKPAQSDLQPRSAPVDLALQEALTELEAAPTREYYNAERDQQARDAYYQGLSARLEPDERYRRLSDLLRETHTHLLKYRPSTHLYPWVDLHEAQPTPKLQSIYSGKDFDPREFIEEDFRVEQERLRLQATLLRESVVTMLGAQELFDALEASMPFNCEHVVPQSWFGKREPMRGDLHHLFACESGCNSFRGNTPYFDFQDFDEIIREACGKREDGKFEPIFGKGAVARATLYFLLRYPQEINRTSKEYTEDRIRTLLEWHKAFPVTRYELHRNAAIHEKQGNRNPLIDVPEWADQIDFMQGLG